MMRMVVFVFEAVGVRMHMVMGMAVFLVSVFVRMVVVMLVFVGVCMLMLMFALAHVGSPVYMFKMVNLDCRYINTHGNRKWQAEADILEIPQCRTFNWY